MGIGSMIMKNYCVSKLGEISNSGVQEYHFEHADFYIDGFIFSYWKKAGAETVEWLYNWFIEKKDIPFNYLAGAYSCIIKTEEKIVAFSDNSNLHCVYYTDNYISNSFLSLLEYELKTGRKCNFDIDSLCEYLTIGNVFFGKTFFSDIYILDSSASIVIEEGVIRKVPKGIGDIDNKSTLLSISEFFDRFAYSVSGYNICQALTGGYDSRMIYACLSSRISDHPTISSNTDSLNDVKYAKEVAEVNDSKLEIVKIPKPEFHENIVEDILQAIDGIEPLDIDTYIRLSTYKKALSTQYDLLITGDGGVLHKDWEWTQDLPFYRRKRSNPKKFYHQRLCYIDYRVQLGNAVVTSYNQQEERFVSELTKLIKDLNTQSYDSWYYQVSGNRRLNYNHSLDNEIIMYAPLLELDLVRYSYALPRHKRFFYNSIRDTITKENIKIARIKTNYGTTASSEKIFIIRDAFFQIGEYCRKAYRLIGRKLLHKNVLVDSFSGWTLEEEIRRSEIAFLAIKYAKDEKLINERCEVDSISYELLNRIIHIYWLARRTGNA